MAVEVGDFCEAQRALFDLDEQLVASIEPEAGAAWSVTLYNDDVHTLQEVQGILVGAGLSASSAHVMAQHAHSQGSCVVVVGNPVELLPFAMNLRGLKIIFADTQQRRREAVISAFISWLYEVATTSDGTCRLVCLAFSNNNNQQLDRILKDSAHLSKHVALGAQQAFPYDYG